MDLITKHKTGKVIWQYFMIAFGIMLYTFSWSVFLIPQKIIAGGVAGATAIIYFATDIPMGVSNFCINAILVVIAFKIMGKKFAVNTLFGIALTSACFILWQQVIHIERIIDASHFELFMNAIIGAGVSAIGIGIAFNNGGNTGGTDIVALIVNKYRNISPGRIILSIDIFIILSAILLPKMGIENIIYGYVVMFVFAYVLDMTIEGNRQSYQITVFSQHNEQIADAILNKVGRGVTLLNGYGWYSKHEQRVLLVLAQKHDRIAILRLIKDIDPQAFISVAKTQGVYGKNFEQLRG
ncbi:MAG: YitT family protein [Bacteroidales bacterium]|nr:YitT family protein [Bacteroidales bacterium]